MTPAFISLSALLTSAHYAINSGIAADNTINADKYQEVYNSSAGAAFECDDSSFASSNLAV